MPNPVSLEQAIRVDLAGAQWNNDPTRFSELHFQMIKDILDQQESDYAR